MKVSISESKVYVSRQVCFTINCRSKRVNANITLRNNEVSAVNFDRNAFSSSEIWRVDKAIAGLIEEFLEEEK